MPILNSTYTVLEMRADAILIFFIENANEVSAKVGELPGKYRAMHTWLPSYISVVCTADTQNY
ncbi:MAG: hypothetical protein K5Q00_05000, partial [Gammaproteobacteria bacterium]|nr:hypothetical protein [Gammaproteobacteria bacterium]